jgi:hypothetical protein
VPNAVIYVFDGVEPPVHDRKSYTARGCEPVVQEETVRVVPAMNPVQLAMTGEFGVGPRSTRSVVRSWVSDKLGVLYVAIGSQTNSIPRLFNSSRVTSTPGFDRVPGLAPFAGWTTKPIGFELIELVGIGVPARLLALGTVLGATPRVWRG